MKQTVLLVIVGLLSQLQFSDAAGVFYVKPTTPNTVCPTGDSTPCHSLQYYANHSSLISNSRFLFLDGDHHLGSSVQVRNVANLSLIGVGSGVKIICESHLAGFHIEEFARLSIESIATSNCSNGKLHLSNGSEVSLINVKASGLMIENVVGSLLVHYSHLTAPVFNYQVCSHPSSFNFSNNEILKSDSSLNDMTILIGCPNVRVLVMNSTFEGRVSVTFNTLTNSSLKLVDNNFITIHCLSVSFNCANKSCGKDFLVRFTRTTVSNSSILFDMGRTENCTGLFEDSSFSDNTKLAFYGSTENLGDRDVEIEFNNVTCDGCFSIFTYIALLCVNSTFQRNLHPVSPITVSYSKVTFEGNVTFKHLSTPIGGAIKLLESSYIQLQPHVSMLFENNHADYVGGVIYAYSDTQSCFYHADSPDTVDVVFINNTAGFAGSALYIGDECCRACKHFDTIFNITNTETAPSVVASDPYTVCFCENGSNQPNCSNIQNVFYYSTQAFPGQDFHIRLAVVGATIGDDNVVHGGVVPGGVMPGAVRAYVDNTTFEVSPSSQLSNKSTCQTFTYSINTAHVQTEVEFFLIPEEVFMTVISREPATSSSSMLVQVYLKECPLVFHPLLANVFVIRCWPVLMLSVTLTIRAS